VRILVTGGAGYIGSFAVRALGEAGHDVVVYDNLSFGHREAIHTELVVADLAEMDALDRCLADGVDAIMHFAASIEAGDSMVHAGPFFWNNTANTIALLNAAVHHGVRQFIFSSTAAVYGDPVRTPIEETDPTVPVNVYGESKLLVERMLPWYERVHGLKSISLRYFNAAGAALDGSMGQDHEPATHIITVAIQTALGQRDRFVLFGEDYHTPDGTCIRDYIHVLDLASGHVAALERLAGDGESGVFNIGAGRGYSNREVIEALKRISGVDFPVQVGPRRPGDSVELIADVAKLRRATGWTPQNSDLDTIVESAWRWHSSHPHGYE